MSSLKGKSPDRAYIKGTHLDYLRALVVFKDSVKLSKELRKVKIKKDEFLKLCESAITSDSEFMLKSLLDTYYQFWKQDVFDHLYEFMEKEKKYVMIIFLNTYIDTVNAKHAEFNTSLS